MCASAWDAGRARPRWQTSGLKSTRSHSVAAARLPPPSRASSLLCSTPKNHSLSSPPSHGGLHRGSRGRPRLATALHARQHRRPRLRSPAQPGLTVAGRRIPLPADEASVAHILRHSAPSPHGQGYATVVDAAVRASHEVAPALVSFANPDWSDALKRMALQAASELFGEPADAAAVGVSLYKLLIYRPGDHFLPHRVPRHRTRCGDARCAGVAASRRVQGRRSGRLALAV